MAMLSNQMVVSLFSSHLVFGALIHWIVIEPKFLGTRNEASKQGFVSSYSKSPTEDLKPETLSWYTRNGFQVIHMIQFRGLKKGADSLIFVDAELQIQILWL